MNQRVTGALLAFSLLSAAGCDKPLSPVEVIDGTRILAAKVEVAGDPTRASPEPGEDASVRFLVVAPDPAATFAYRFDACVAADSSSDLARCGGAALGTAVSVEPVAEPPSVTFTAPGDASSGTRLAVIGGACAAGVALGDETGASCADGSKPYAATDDFFMDDGTSPNTNPALTDVGLNDVVLDPATATLTDCSVLPNVAVGSGPRTLAVNLDPASRDPLVQVAASDPARESLLISYFITQGDLDHAFSDIDADATDLRGSVSWTPPSNADGPTLARFIVVVRDGRGGSDFTERRLCVVP
ncbi:MAG TPA: hypothetical protein VMI54_21350 [Polyangiaceae bacterium]|nr:hypothetical protein [Polyangiaceae bacterium]